MSRIENRFAQLKAAGRCGLVPYIVAGDPAPGYTVAMMHALVANGADIIELGVPFSDPMAEGPAIQLGHERALMHGVGLRDVIAMVGEFRETDSVTPVLLMGYTNPIEAMGYSHFANTASVAGIDAVLTVDMPPEELEGFDRILRDHDIDNVLLVSPTTSDERITQIVGLARGFIYFVSLKGVTGAGHLDVEAVAADYQRLRAQTQLPLAVGFGIKDVAAVKAVGAIADAVVVGSALVELMGAIDRDLSATEAVIDIARLVSEMRAGLDTLESAE